MGLTTKTEELIVIAYERLSKAKELLNGTNDPVCSCRVCRIHGANFVEIHSNSPGTAYISQVQHCKKVWTCPLCSLQISNERRAALAALVQHERESGVATAMVTYTLRHAIRDKLLRTLNLVKAAHKRMHSGRKWNDFVQRNAWRGSVIATEITFTPNGWHPHLHEIVFFVAVDGAKSTIETALEPMRAMWLAAVSALGGSADSEHGLNIKAAYGPVTEYVGKWSIVPELVRGAHKAGREGSIVPFQLLDCCVQNPSRSGFERDLFLEYRSAVHGLHQLHPSPAFRGAMMVKKDAVNVDDESLLAKLDRSAWMYVVDQGLRADMLIAARRGELKGWLDINDIRQR